MPRAWQTTLRTSAPGLYRESPEESYFQAARADDQRRVHIERGMDGLLDYLVERTV